MVLVAGPPLLYAQPNTLYFMKGIPQTKDLNPARPGISEGYYFSMPLFSKIDLSANTNNWAYNDLIHRGKNYISNTNLNNTNNLNNTYNNINWNQSDSLVIDLEKFRQNISDKNFVYEAAALTVLEGGFKKGKNFYAISLSEREFAQAFFHKNLVDLFYLGNYPYIGKTWYSGNLGVVAQHYREFAFNYSRDLTKKLTIGGAAKILFGMSAIHSNGLNFKATSPANGEYIDVTASGRVNISAPVIFNYNMKGDISSVSSLPNYGPGDYLKNLKNPGIAIDLGFAYRVNKETELSASVVDLGMIGWKSNVTQFTEQGEFRYQGIDITDPANNPPVISLLNPVITRLGDSIATIFRPNSDESRFSTLLPAKIYFGIDHQVSDVVSISALSRIRIISNTVHTSLTASANAYVLNGLSLTASYSVMESTYDNLGLGVGFRGGPFQIYAAADNMISPFYPAKARNMNLRIGINFIFDDRSSKNQNGLNSNCHCPY